MLDVPAPPSRNAAPAVHRPAVGRPHEARRTRQNILEAARAVFAEKGYSGANVNEIVAAAGTTKPMVYYHFGSKQGLFAAVLEDVYAGMRGSEEALQLTGLPVVQAMRCLVQGTFDYHAAHPEWVRLISVANIHDAEHLRASPALMALNLGVVDILGGVLDRGVAEGAFRSGVDPLRLHLMIASFCFYRVSNRHTWGVIFGRDLVAPEEAEAQRAMIADAVLRFLQPDAALAGPA